MSFIYSCIGDNTPENREHLEKLGYKKECGTKRDPFIYTCNDSEYLLLPEQDLFEPDKLIDCRKNDALFRAVTAIRDDSDYMQWFTNGKRFAFCEEESFDRPTHYWHKSTLAELQERFK